MSILAGKSSRFFISLSVLGILSGLCGFYFVTLLNKSIQLLIAGDLIKQQWKLFYVFSGTILLFFFTRRILSKAVINLSQNIFWNFRRGIIKTILTSDFKLLNASKNDIHSTLTTDAYHITGASLLVIELTSSSILTLTCITYMAFISFPLFVISLSTILIGVAIYQYGAKKSNILFTYTRNLEQQFLLYFNAIIEGNKEINIEPKKGNDIYTQKINPICEDALKNNIDAYTGYLNNQIIGQILFYILITTIVLFSGSYFKIGNIINFVFILLYLLAPIENILVILPSINTGNIALNKVLSIKARLEKETPLSSNKTGTEKTYLDFEYLTVKQLEYVHTDNHNVNSFHIGPIDFELNKGEVAFIYGGNGSGKTTFLYCLIGMYSPIQSSISIGNTLIQPTNLNIYKSLFGAIFSDFYLFDELYGLSNPNPEILARYLTLFELENKVTITDGKFSTIGLSTGQRKRLALVAILMEAKPILVLDEWAADQDPAFRKKFYTQIIPFLKAEGFTIIAITHDDIFYPCADKLYRMEYGSLIEEQIKTEDVISYFIL